MSSEIQTPQELAEWKVLKGNLTWLGYLTLAGITVLLWDALLTIQLEMRYIWRKAPWGVQLAFGLNRYGMGILLAEMLWTSVPRQSLDTPMVRRSAVPCRGATYVVALLTCIVDTMGNVLTVYRVFLLWDRSPRIMKRMLIGAAVTFACTALFASIICVQQFNSLEWDAAANSCVLTTYNSYYTGMWTTQALFEIYAACLIFFNTLNIPRTSDWQIWNMLYNDGIIIIIIIVFAVLRILNVIISSLKNAVYTLIGVSIVSAMISTLNSRLVLRLYQRQEKKFWLSHEISMELEQLSSISPMIRDSIKQSL
ncbi:hypothetical protein BJ138DRAFT_1145528 [Hygrophoropsis aurantiaca]|uniref:Uncharacterized protein n=1 Tax=Hygrophoropsis aurantiaca TaxID=72124 RepID=A0ACB8AKB4_9AGAM|nr:hypothetical protein BJ138DRAFT_1145528 [Hygrophoropsis aurantiaca]